jgi:HPt (histidine-containing phosphotransfer) domain-containing protein
MTSIASIDTIQQGPALDRDILDGLFDLVDDEDDSFVRDLFESFVGSFADAHAGMQAALAAGDPEAMRLHAHSLKGSSGNLGALALSDIAKELQQMGDEGDLSSAGPWVDAAQEEYDRVMLAVLDLLPGFEVA